MVVVKSPPAVEVTSILQAASNRLLYSRGLVYRSVGRSTFLRARRRGLRVEHGLFGFPVAKGFSTR